MCNLVLPSVPGCPGPLLDMKRRTLWAARTTQVLLRRD